jgi:hypothetical protein
VSEKKQLSVVFWKRSPQSKAFSQPSNRRPENNYATGLKAKKPQHFEKMLGG